MIRTGDKTIQLSEITAVRRTKNITRMKSRILYEIGYTKEWNTRDLKWALYQFDCGQWNEEWIPESLLKQYLELEFHDSKKIPKLIRVPKAVLERIKFETGKEAELNEEERLEESRKVAAWAKAKKPQRKVKEKMQHEEQAT